MSDDSIFASCTVMYTVYRIHDGFPEPLLARSEPETRRSL